MTKQILFILFNLFFSCFSYGQKEDIEVSYEKLSTGNIILKYRKNVPGNIYLTLTFTELINSFSSGYRGVVSNPFGKLLTLKPQYRFKGIDFSYMISYVRGRPNPPADSSVILLLPFKKETRVAVTEVGNLEEKFFNNIRPKNWKVYQFRISGPDTVYASRRGMVVEVIDQYDVDTTMEYGYSSERNSILVEHQDGTFGSYSGFAKNSIFVSPGQQLIPGTPLGTIGRADKRKIYNLYFKTYFLTKPEIVNKENKTLSTLRSMHQYYTPVFYTQNGNQKLKDGETYIADISDEIIIQELSRKEIRKLKK